MSEQEKKDLADIQDLQIESLSDSDLDSVAGGLITDTCSGCTSHSYCTNVTAPPPTTNPGPATPIGGGFA